MTIHRRDLVGSAVLALLVICAGAAPALADPRFPEVSGDNLEGETLSLPGDLAGEVNLLLIAFKRDQQDDIDTWQQVGEELESRVPGFRFYELPVMSQGIRVMRGVIEGGMRSGIEDPADRARTIPLFTDKPALREASGIETEESIQLLLVDREGRVLWHGEGPYAEATGAALAAAIAAR